MDTRPTPFGGSAVSAAPRVRNLGEPALLSPSAPRKAASTIAANRPFCVGVAAVGMGTNFPVQAFGGASDDEPVTSTSSPAIARFIGPGPRIIVACPALT